MNGGKRQARDFLWMDDESPIDLRMTQSNFSRHLNNSGEYCGGFDSTVNNKLNDMYCLNKADFFCEFECWSGLKLDMWLAEKTSDVLNLSDSPR